MNQKCGVPIGAVLSMLTVVFMSTWMPTHIPKDAIGCLRPYDRGVDQEQHVHSMFPAMQQLPVTVCRALTSFWALKIG